eukprot:6395249-Pyramimonas_sp.AAC.1
MRTLRAWASHADPAAGAFGGAQFGATTRVRGVPNMVRYRQGLRWDCLRGPGTCEGCAESGAGNAGPAAGTFARVPDFATTRV